MEKYNYMEAMKKDIREYLEDDFSIDSEEFAAQLLNDREQLEQDLYERLWIVDSVTGNASGSYTFNTWEAEENLCHNMDLLSEALEEFGSDANEALERGAEYCDVIIRCYLLGAALSEVLGELEEEAA